MSFTTETANGIGSISLVRELETAPGESLFARLRRWALGTAWALKPPRTRSVPSVLYLMARHYTGLDPYKGELPYPENALAGGVAGICADLDVDTLMMAYGRGLYPFSHVGPQKWLAPEERMVLFFENFDMEKNLRRRLRNRHFDVTFDQDFEGVVRGCAELRPGRPPLTWITPSIIEAYCKLFNAGHAHSVEVWDREGNLVGGVYGVAVGKIFFTESQFMRVRDASKVGFATLNCHLQHWGFALNDGKSFTPHLSSVGFRLVLRDAFNSVLASRATRGALPAEPGKGRWCVDETLDVGNWDPKASEETPGNIQIASNQLSRALQTASVTSSVRA